LNGRIVSFHRRRLFGLRRDRGQSVVEFALVAPIMIVLLVAIVDFARVYTTMVTVESAAREAADYGTTLGAVKWDPAVATTTEAEMKRRACIASMNLPDYADADSDPATGCDNPVFEHCIQPSDLSACGPLNPLDGCEVATREPPCWVKVTLTYDFQLFSPIRLEILGATIGFPASITIKRDSVFAITDIEEPSGP
jgi:Flp pilus assembly protein TadG